ncbi:hypothetical protein [Deminuibacter soli]|uniref:Uncharacterized protein n=1 Tax=Deminuibacter soli TaxID=2291815 RepID=A0A3E1NFB6_9BACT|nr:hypothetical protein [Deminuibacter soli]RFM26562.1 hypothetical protein DXN05_18465 [Deminuibacter soli]
MKTFLPTHIIFTFPLLIVQSYLVIYVSLLLLRRMKLLKRPYSGMNDAETLPAAFILLGVLIISSANAPALFQAVKSFGETYTSITEPFLLFYARSFLVTLFTSLLFIALNFVNLRFLFRADYPVPNLPVNLLICAIGVGFAIICWYTCREVLDNMTPQYINFR